ncbi:MAG: hypothetical protein H7Y22_10795 [Gemmatimonadaceae bacterium]|nr:hypothetical protein [Gloeobacterales cyanobacterium ES-bin-141]
MSLVKAIGELNAQVRRREPWNAAVYALLSALAGFVVFLGPTHAQNQFLAWLVQKASDALPDTLPNVPASLVLLWAVVLLLAAGSLRPPWRLAQQLAMALIGVWLALAASASPFVVPGADASTLTTLRAEALLLSFGLVCLNLGIHALSVPINYLVLLAVALTLAKNFSDVANNVLVGAQWHLGLAFVASAAALYTVKLATKRYLNF